MVCSVLRKFPRTLMISSLQIRHDQRMIDDNYMALIEQLIPSCQKEWNSRCAFSLKLQDFSEIALHSTGLQLITAPQQELTAFDFIRCQILFGGA